MPDSNLHKLSALGQSVWLDYLSRDILQNGELERMMREDAVVGVTSNPTIFQKALAHGDAYDDQLREIADGGETDLKEIFLKLSSHDVADACELLRKVWDEGEGLDGYVSWEVDPNLASDRDATVAEAKRLHELGDKPNLYVKIPATEPGVEAIEAYIRGLERLVENGGDPSTVHSVASFFVSRVDTEADKRLENIGSDEAPA